MSHSQKPQGDVPPPSVVQNEADFSMNVGRRTVETADGTVNCIDLAPSVKSNTDIPVSQQYVMPKFLEYLQIRKTIDYPEDGPVEILLRASNNSRVGYFLAMFAFHRCNAVVRVDLRLPLGATTKAKIGAVPPDVRVLTHDIYNHPGTIVDFGEISTHYFYIPYMLKKFCSTSIDEPFAKFFIQRISQNFTNDVSTPLHMTISISMIDVTCGTLIDVTDNQANGLKEGVNELMLTTTPLISSGDLVGLSWVWSLLGLGAGLVAEVFMPGSGPVIKAAVDFTIAVVSSLIRDDVIKNLNIPNGSYFTFSNVGGFLAISVPMNGGAVVTETFYMLDSQFSLIPYNLKKDYILPAEVYTTNKTSPNASPTAFVEFNPGRRLHYSRSRNITQQIANMADMSFFITAFQLEGTGDSTVNLTSSISTNLDGVYTNGSGNDPAYIRIGTSSPLAFSYGFFNPGEFKLPTSGNLMTSTLVSPHRDDNPNYRTEMGLMIFKYKLSNGNTIIRMAIGLVEGVTLDQVFPLTYLLDHSVMISVVNRATDRCYQVDLRDGSPGAWGGDATGDYYDMSSKPWQFMLCNNRTGLTNGSLTYGMHTIGTARTAIRSSPLEHIIQYNECQYNVPSISSRSILQGRAEMDPMLELLAIQGMIEMAEDKEGEANEPMLNPDYEYINEKEMQEMVDLFKDKMETFMPNGVMVGEFQSKDGGAASLPENDANAPAVPIVAQIGNAFQPIGSNVAKSAASENIFVPLFTLNVTKDLNIFSPINPYFWNNPGNLQASHPQFEAIRHAYCSAVEKDGCRKFVTYKITSSANAFVNGRLLVTQIPDIYTAAEISALTLEQVSQYNRKEHILHGSETIYETQWQKPLPHMNAYDEVDVNGHLIIRALEYTENAPSTSPAQITVWVRADNICYSLPIAPRPFVPLVSGRAKRIGHQVKELTNKILESIKTKNL